MKEQDHVVFGCLNHDIGKLFERAEVFDDYRQDEEKRQLYCKKHKDGYYTHIHVLNTLKACEVLYEHIPQLKPEEQQRIESADQNWVNLAAFHHNPSTRNVAYLEKIVQSADHFASAEREQGGFYEQGIHKKTRLESLLGRINLAEEPRENDYFLPLNALTLSNHAIFPKQAVASEMELKANDNKKVWLCRNPLIEDYKKIAEQYVFEFKGLQTFQPNVDKTKIHKSTIRSLLCLMEHHLSQVPAATNIVHPDISLYDHLRITAAIGEGLYLHHQVNDGEIDYENQSLPKWQLVCGDFSGIQKFIYKITNKGAAKGLRGRSFFIQLMCDAVSEHIIRKLGLYATARIYSSGGKFYLLIPSHLKAQVERIAESVN